MPRPPFALGRKWRKRASHAKGRIDERVWYDSITGFEYAPDPDRRKRTWHEVDWRHRLYREIDENTGLRVAGGEGEWRPLR